MQRQILVLVLSLMTLPFTALPAHDLPQLRDKKDNLLNRREIIEAMHRPMIDNLNKILSAEQISEMQNTSNWPDYDIIYYDIHWQVDMVGRSISGSVGTYGRSNLSGLDSVIVNLTDSLTVDSIIGPSGNLTFVHASGNITVYLDRSYSAGEVFGFTVVYHGVPPHSEGRGLWFSSNGDYPVLQNLSEPYLSYLWWPCNDLTADKADSIDVRITVDAELFATSNGLLISNVNNGDGTRTLHWQSHYPISTYLVCLAVGKYTSWTDYYVYSSTDSMPIINYAFADQSAVSQAIFQYTASALDLFVELYGEYPFLLEKYGHTQTFGNLGMEHQTNTFMIFTTDYTESVVIHELAHQWWGDLVTCGSWHDIWLNEGFATYSEALYAEALYGFTYYQNYMQALDYFDSGPVYSYDTTQVWPGIFNNRVYVKGAWVLHMLRHELGDSLFFASLQTYLQTYAYSTALTGDFQAVCETVSGQNLEPFFQQWIYGVGRPDFRHAYFCEPNPAGGWDTYIILRQVQTIGPQVFYAKVDVNLRTATGYELFALNDSLVEQYFVVHTENEVTRMEIDPNGWLLCYETWEHFRIRIWCDTISDGVQYEPYTDTIIIVGGYPGHDFVCQVISGAMPPGWNLESSTGIISGETLESGDFSFMVLVTDAIFINDYRDSTEFVVHVEPGTPRSGDANYDGQVNVGDAVFLINHIFKGGPPPTILNWADVNADCQVNVGDAVYLIYYIFKGGNAPQLGCVE